ncbi:hypothetical protein [Glaciibacter psychrotolerans]|uniref:Uncharacterized protein n=1 Tax=Glaciibacter psychrotolerans TaxID=670054 RepID=A0A7Z0J5V4_9MICO|nr:hypothetical protein [Leifsonia psychrotolerans]NYJ19536.1 hypothetical protein [Leifsonia psychrotolerans]
MSRPQPRYRRTMSANYGEPWVDMPVALPLVVMTIGPDATMTVTVDGEPYAPPPFGPPWGRSSFATILDELTVQRHCPVRVEVNEADGTVFTDIITPFARRNRAPVPGLMREPEPSPVSLIPAPIEAQTIVGGEGFIPGEDVAVAVIVAHTGAAPDGSARSFVTEDIRAFSATSEVILLGRISGTLILVHAR